MSFPASLPVSIPAAIVETILLNLLGLFLPGAAGDATQARQAALHMLASFAPRNEQELCVAADTISFELHALQALRQSDEPDTPPAHVLRLRSGAVSLQREARQVRQELRRMQQGTADPAAPETIAESPPPLTIPPLPDPIDPDQAVALVDEARRVVAAARHDVQQGRFKGVSYSQALQKRMTAQRLLQKQKGRTAEPAIRPVPSGPQAAAQAAAPA